MRPTEVRLSKHFMLSDFMGCDSVYRRGYTNIMDDNDPDLPLKFQNARALTDHILEPLLEQAGPVSISYGYISPELSHQIVRYQDPDKPSHHRWDLGAAADVCVHEWVNHPEDDCTNAPIGLALRLDEDQYPFSRLITYSESPYICLACSAKEMQEGKPRGAFYENQYQGVSKEKPKYVNLSSGKNARDKRAEKLVYGLEHGWKGAGYPTYHGGGRLQYQHTRLSKYTMLSDWLYHEQSVMEGHKNHPPRKEHRDWALLNKASALYDDVVQNLGYLRMSILRGYIGTNNPFYPGAGSMEFQVAPPEGFDDAALFFYLSRHRLCSKAKVSKDGATVNIVVTE